MAKKILIIISIIVATIALGVGGTYIAKSKVGKKMVKEKEATSPPQEATDGTDKTSNQAFSGYENVDWGFEVQFPQEFWYCPQNCPEGASPSCFVTCNLSEDDYHGITFSRMFLLGGGPAIEQFAFKAREVDAKALSPESRCPPIMTHTFQRVDNYTLRSHKKVGKVTFMKWEKEHFVNDSMWWVFEKAVEYIGEYNNVCYYISYATSRPGGPGMELDEKLKLLDQILNTFKVKS